MTRYYDAECMMPIYKVGPTLAIAFGDGDVGISDVTPPLGSAIIGFTETEPSVVGREFVHSGTPDVTVIFKNKGCIDVLIAKLVSIRGIHFGHYTDNPASPEDAKAKAERDRIALSETKTALTRTHAALLNLCNVLDHETGLSPTCEEVMRSAELTMADVPTRLMEK